MTKNGPRPDSHGADQFVTGTPMIADVLVAWAVCPAVPERELPGVRGQ